MAGQILGPHPDPPHPIGSTISSIDGLTDCQILHRTLLEREGSRPALVESTRTWLANHHASPEALARSAAQRQAISKLGVVGNLPALSRFPRSDTTRKGNLAEILLAEYVQASNNLTLPIYRLRYNPNVEQSMKGDDVLAFDLDADPPTVIVGEAKFRSTPSKQAADQILEALLRSYKSVVPISLHFIADMLFAEGKPVLGKRIGDLAIEFCKENLTINYVGLLISNTEVQAKVNTVDASELRRVALLSFGMNDLSAFVEDSYRGLE